ncbi:MAG: HD domain-containing protein [Alteromonadaceae bacterium]|nr:HD domain-containing protein [Alteromonadaceae bacterium]
MQLINDFSVLDKILQDYKVQIGEDFIGYRNHLYRMLNFANCLGRLGSFDLEKMMIAAAFHDIGIWTKSTVDYIEPSVHEARHWLHSSEYFADEQEILDMISLHHKVRQVKDHPSPLVELFRRADLVDFSLGLITFGVPSDFIKTVKQVYPNAGFHKCLMRLSWRQFKSQPINPLPMMKW